MIWKAMALGLALMGASCGSPAAAPERTPITIGESLQLQSRLLGEKRLINVYLPPDYADPQKRFPVLYLLDGGLDQNFMHVVGSARLGAIRQISRQPIIVGIQSGDRPKEFANPTLAAQERIQFPTAGKSAQFRAFIRDEVKPLIERRFRTSGEDAIIGESLAGLFVVETYLEEPQLFGAYAALSPSLWWNFEQLAVDAPEALARPDRPRVRLFLSISDEGGGMQAGVDRLIGALGVAKGWCYAPRPDLSHATIFHAVAPMALQFLFPPEKPPSSDPGLAIRCAKQG